MRILHTSDFHLGKNLEGFSRMDEQEEFLTDFIKIVEDNSVDLVIISGDIYDTSNPPARAENMFYKMLKDVSNHGERMILIISGNHDNPDRLVAARPLASEHGIVMVATPKTVVPVGQYGKNTIVNSGEGFIEATVNGEDIVILNVPYPSEKRLNEVLYTSMDDEDDRAESYSDRIKKLFSNLSENFKENTINIATSHLFAMGSEEAGSERSIQLGGSFIVDSNCFPSNAQYVALGHIHKPMIVPGTDGKVRYSGSPLQYSKKESSFKKGCYLLDIHANDEAIIDFKEFKIYKPIETWKCGSIEEAIELCEENSERNCWVYLEIKTDRYILDEEIKKMKGFKKDILEIKPVLNIDYEEDVCDQNFSDKSFKEIFTDFYVQSRGVQPTDEVVDMLLSIMEGDED